MPDASYLCSNDRMPPLSTMLVIAAYRIGLGVSDCASSRCSLKDFL